MLITKVIKKSFSNNICSQTYAGDFNCHEADAYTEQGLSKAWWRDQMDEHSAKIIEIEKMTGLKVSLGKALKY